MSYHRYSDDQGAVADPAEMLSYHRSIASVVASNAFAGELLNDEFAASWKPDVSRDTEVSASFIAKTVHLIGTDTLAAPPASYGYWALSDLYEEVYHGNGLAFNEGNFGLLLKGDPAIPQSFDIGKPAFNAFRLLHRMGDTSVAMTGGTSSDGVGGAATVSADGSALQILVYNHVAGGQADPTQATSITLSANNIPFAPGPVRIRQYVVDHTHAECIHGLGQDEQTGKADARSSGPRCGAPPSSVTTRRTRTSPRARGPFSSPRASTAYRSSKSQRP